MPKDSRKIDQKTVQMRKLLFTPCKTKKALHDWIKLFFDLDLPDCIVDPESNATPMDAVWESYEECLKEEKDRTFTRTLVYAARETGKTLAQSVFECLSLLHLKKNAVHGAALEQQSAKAQGYIREFFNKPYLRDFVVGNNKRAFEIIRYFNKSNGEYLTEKEWEKLDSSSKNDYVEQKNQTIVIVATLKSSNGQHAPTLCIDEVELIDNPQVLEELKMVPEVRDGKSPLTYITSSRKFAGGVVQKEIDRAETSGLAVRHWNLIDCTESCPTERHRPDLPKLQVYYSRENLKTLEQDKYDELTEKEKDSYRAEMAYQGCVSNCKLFAMCRGHLATRQTSTSKMLKPISRVTSQFAEIDTNVAKAQLLCWTPSNEGMIYSRLNREIHFKTPAQIAEIMTGDEFDEKTFTKHDLVNLMKTKEDAIFYAGMDFGSTHKFAVVVACVWGSRVFIIEAIAESELELNQQIELCNQKIKHYNPIIFPDMAEPQYIKTFKRHGFEMRQWNKVKGTVLGGIEIVRSKISSALGKPELFFLKGDAGVLEAFKQMQDYRWKVDPEGNFTEDPRKVDDDLCFSEEVEALTNSGWKKIKEMDGSELVMSVSSDGTGQWEKPLKIIKKEYQGDGYSIDHVHLKFRATSDHAHAVISQYDWKTKSKNLFNLKKQTIPEMKTEMFWPTNIPNWPIGEGFFEQGTDEAWITGMWIAEGCFDSNRPTFLIIDQAKPENIVLIENKIKTLGWMYSKTVIKKTQPHHLDKIRFVISGQKDRAGFWRKNYGSGAKNKRLPLDFIDKMSSEERKALWEGYMIGDGSRTQSAWHFDSTSESLLDSIQILTLMIGYGCVKNQYEFMKNRTVTANGKAYIGSDIFRGSILRRKSVSHIETNLFQKIKMNEEVFCLRTTTGFFMARSNGKPFVAGNCDSARYLIMNVFNAKNRIMAAKTANDNLSKVQNHQNWMEELIRDALGEEDIGPDMPSEGKKGKIGWSF